MPWGYLITVALIAVCTGCAAAPLRRPRTSRTPHVDGRDGAERAAVRRVRLPRRGDTRRGAAARPRHLGRAHRARTRSALDGSARRHRVARDADPRRGCVGDARRARHRRPPLPAGDAAHPPRTVRRHSSRRQPLRGHPVRRGREPRARRLPAAPSRRDRTGARLLPRRRLSRRCQEPRGQTARLPAREPRVAVRERELRASSRSVLGVVGRRACALSPGLEPARASSGSSRCRCSSPAARPVAISRCPPR